MESYDLFGEPIIEKTNLKKEFPIIPFSILDTKTIEWRERKLRWLSLGIKSEQGRDQDLLGFQRIYSKGNKRLLDRKTSVFDPVLCELMYSWFCKKNDYILDPFAGGSVRGIISNYLNYNYTGIELREEQVYANIQQGIDICFENQPNWICGDSNKVLDTIDMRFDFIFSCPPYYDLEKYCDDPNDVSNMSYNDFLNTYKSIIEKSCKLLKDNRFACFVVGDIRDKDRTCNWYRNFVGETKQIFIDNGLNLYNEFILLEGIGTSAMRVKQAFTKRKCIKLHQNILVFYKGNNVNDIRDRFK